MYVACMICSFFHNHQKTSVTQKKYGHFTFWQIKKFQKCAKCWASGQWRVFDDTFCSLELDRMRFLSGPPALWIFGIYEWESLCYEKNGNYYDHMSNI